MHVWLESSAWLPSTNEVELLCRVTDVFSLHLKYKHVCLFVYLRTLSSMPTNVCTDTCRYCIDVWYAPAVTDIHQDTERRPACSNHSRRRTIQESPQQAVQTSPKSLDIQWKRWRCWCAVESEWWDIPMHFPIVFFGSIIIIVAILVSFQCMVPEAHTIVECGHGSFHEGQYIASVRSPCKMPISCAPWTLGVDDREGSAPGTLARETTSHVNWWRELGLRRGSSIAVDSVVQS